VFPPTDWSDIVASRADPATRARVLGELARAYWQPLYTLARRRGLADAAAQDAVQELFARLLARKFLDGLDRERGRLRGFLRLAMERVIAHDIERRCAQKRGGGRAPVELHDAIADDGLAPDAAFDQAWRAALVDRAFARLAAEHRSGPFEVIALYVRDPDPPPLAELAIRHATTVACLKSLLHRARQRLRAIIVEEVAATASDVDAELRALGDGLQL
jgi:DNA-directed RNA polymerase specialized sigma24 family protein